MDPLASALQYLKGVGPRRAADLQRVGLTTVEDLLYRFPTRYEDRGAFRTIASLRPGMVSSVLAEVISSGIRPTRRPRFKIFEMLVRDRTGALRAVFFNQPFLADVFHAHQRVILYGKLELTSHGLQMQNPQYEVVKTDGDEEEAQSDVDALHTGRIVPIYEKTGTLTTKMQRVLVHQALAQLPETLPDPLPEDVRQRQQLIDRRRALADVHFPPEGTNLDALNTFRSDAHRRLIFEEFFLFQLGIVLRKRRSDAERKSRPVVITEEIRESARRVLPFKLTGDQKKALGEIVGDMQRPQPMNRLLQGDVGSGKTIVALVAALVAMENGLQVAFMAPTEILAEQHFINIRRLLERSRFRLTMITGATPAKRRRELQAELSGGSMQMVVGTHALIEEAVGFRELGLVIIDEQHRFGVLQRAALRAKGLHPDVLVMTATPIPRTLALTAYGDLDTSIIREMPPGRHPIKTTVRPEERRDRDLRFHPRSARSRTPGVRHLPAGRRVRQGRSQGGNRDGRPSCAGGLPGLPRRSAARQDEAGCQGPGHGRLHARRTRRAGLDDGGGGRCRRRERQHHGGRTRGAVRTVAAAPAARKGRARPARVVLHPDVSGTALRGRPTSD